MNKFQYYSFDYPEIDILLMKDQIPDWYKHARPFIDLEKETRNFKSCGPFMDSFVSGYGIPLPFDLTIKLIDGEPHFESEVNMIEDRGDSHFEIVQPKGHYATQYAWKNTVDIQLPKGYSFLLTHPFNRYDLPFTTMSGIVDADYIIWGGNTPFYLKKGWEGTIKKGTIIAQILPFKREEWKSEKHEVFNKTDEEEKDYVEHLTDGQDRRGWYKKWRWVRKVYE